MMAWQYQSTRADTYVSTDLTDFDPPQLLQGLIDAQWLSESEAESIQGRSQPRHNGRTLLPAATAGAAPLQFLDVRELSVARADLASGRRQEALVHLERYLGRDWYGVLAEMA